MVQVNSFLLLINLCCPVLEDGPLTRLLILHIDCFSIKVTVIMLTVVATVQGILLYALVSLSQLQLGEAEGSSVLGLISSFRSMK